MEDLEQTYWKPDSYGVSLSAEKCQHFFYRKNASEVGCEVCPTVWIDNGRFIIENRKIIGKREY